MDDPIYTAIVIATITVQSAVIVTLMKKHYHKISHDIQQVKTAQRADKKRDLKTQKAAK